MREPRLGDIIDDYCVKCKRIMNHAVVSLLNSEPAKVRCRTCHNDHDYRHEQPPPPKVDARKQALFNEVLAKVAPGTTVAAEVPETFLEDTAEEILAQEEPAEEAFAEEAPIEEMSEEHEEKQAPKLKKPKAVPATLSKAVAKTKTSAHSKANAKGAKASAASARGRK
ncbi:MAG: hypothetical protein ABSH24_31230 [Bryobacteraceae bacterium]|jgi:hypothetical protein